MNEAWFVFAILSMHLLGLWAGYHLGWRRCAREHQALIKEERAELDRQRAALERYLNEVRRPRYVSLMMFADPEKRHRLHDQN
jgi:hypothetical protein